MVNEILGDVFNMWGKNREKNLLQYTGCPMKHDS